MWYIIVKRIGGVWHFYVGMNDWSTSRSEAAMLTEEDAYDTRRIVGGNVEPY